MVAANGGAPGKGARLLPCPSQDLSVLVRPTRRGPPASTRRVDDTGTLARARIAVAKQIGPLKEHDASPRAAARGKVGAWVRRTAAVPTRAGRARRAYETRSRALALRRRRPLLLYQAMLDGDGSRALAGPMALVRLRTPITARRTSAVPRAPLPRGRRPAGRVRRRAPLSARPKRASQVWRPSGPAKALSNGRPRAARPPRAARHPRRAAWA